MGKIIVLTLLIVITMVSCKSQSSSIDKSVVKVLDIEKYMGKWYEISRYDHKFERGLVGVTATYFLNDNGTVRVENAGYKQTLDGKKSLAIGKAKIPDNNEPAKLKVSFFAFFYADYFVLDLDENYQWAVVGSSSDKYLWILSRDPKMDSALYSEITGKLTKRGYDISKLIQVKQKT
ncbi:MAG: lipocalin family protein [Candidatus Cloacimonetes bacterium]|nr:lipocalin family protein [Candidatus Cloacimonadota bacterium]